MARPKSHRPPGGSTGVGKVFEVSFSMMKTGALCLILGLVISHSADAKVARRKSVPIPIPVMQGPEGVTYKDVEKLVPLDMLPTDNAGHVATRIGDRALQQILNSPEMQRSSVARAASKVEGSMKAEVSMGSSEPDAVQHRMSFQYMALQATGRVQYKGWMNAVMNYDTRNGETQVEVTEKLFKNKDVYINHTANSVEDISALGVRWSW